MGDRFKDFVQFAIEQEVNAYTLYERYAEVVKSRPAKQLLNEMAQMERSHEEKLRKFADQGVAYFSRIGELEDAHLSDYMVPTVLTETSSIEDVFVFAMKAEEKAHELYSALSRLETDETTKTLFRNLAAEEKKHRHDLETEYEKGVMQEN